ncbi:serum amyloid P-component-like [Chanos chanos]|uniref:Pentraxin family member n=1 Tax=Chanos chanos TaxID=29144 RepID=A0A6J2V8R3_CHACN|nr:serum amyloid P-component-like [Chanos chanos]
MRTLAFFLTLFSICAAERRDLSGKVFTFPRVSATDYTTLTPDVEKILFSVTVCLRFFTDLSNSQTLFSLATRSHADGFVLFRRSQGHYQLYLADTGVDFYGLPDKLIHWNSLCVTWDSSTGLSQLWVNGEASSRKALHPGGSIIGTPSIILGQDQDSYGGGFHTYDCFVGQLSDVHMWDRILSPCEVMKYTDYMSFPPGNMLNWQNLEFSRQGYVVVEDNRAPTHMTCPGRD